MPKSTCALIRVYILLVLSGPGFRKSRRTDDTLANIAHEFSRSLPVYYVLACALPIHNLISRCVCVLLDSSISSFSHIRQLDLFSFNIS